MRIIADTREKTGYDFSFHLTDGQDVENRKLDYGDYSVSGLEDKVAIERKASTGELSLNFGSGRKRFYREIEVLSTFDHAVFLMEFPESYLYSFPAGSKIPRNKLKYLRMNSGFLAKSVFELRDKYGFELVFCENSDEAELWAYSFLTRMNEQYARDLPDIN